jgi:chromosome segregation ATPase
MIRKAIVIVIALLTSIGLLAGCGGVKQADLDAANAAKATAEAQVTSLQSQLTATNTAKTKAEADLAVANTAITKAQTDLAASQKALTDAQAKATSDLVSAKADLATAQNNLSKSNTDLSTAQQSFSTLNTSVKTAQSFVDVAIAYINFEIVANIGSETDIVAAFVTTSTAVSATKDTTLNDAWNAVMAQGTDSSVMTFLKLLGQRLTETKPKTN